MFDLAGQCGAGRADLTNADLLEGLHNASRHDMDMPLEPAVFSELLRREFIKCDVARQAGRKPDVRCVEGTRLTASMTERGHGALDWLRSIARSSQWERLRSASYGE
jgi:hypothetical protein